MNSNFPNRSVSNTTFRMGLIEIPVSIYKGNDRMGLSGQLFHEGCNGKIRQWKSCELHPNTEDPATYSGAVIGDHIVPLTSDVKTTLLGGDCKIDVVCSHPTKNLSKLITEGIISPECNYQLTPQKHFEEVFSTLLDRLRISRTFLLVHFPEGKMQRYGILLSSGVFLGIFYQEEIRAMRFEPTSPRSELKKDMDRLIAQYKMEELPRLSGANILQRVEDWFNSIVLKINRERGRTKVTT